MLAPHEHPHGLRHALHAIASHTGVPVVLVAAVLLVVSWRLFRSLGRLLVQVLVAVVVLLGLTHFGIIAF